MPLQGSPERNHRSSFLTFILDIQVQRLTLRTRSSGKEKCYLCSPLFVTFETSASWLSVQSDIILYYIFFMYRPRYTWRSAADLDFDLDVTCYYLQFLIEIVIFFTSNAGVGSRVLFLAPPDDSNQNCQFYKKVGCAFYYYKGIIKTDLNSRDNELVSYLD